MKRLIVGLAGAALLAAPALAQDTATLKAIGQGRADVYIVNYANCDMVGHTGVMSAAVAAVEAVDDGVGRVLPALREKGGVAVGTADHGNAERILDSDGTTPFTAHTTDELPLIAVADGVDGVREGGIPDKSQWNLLLHRVRSLESSVILSSHLPPAVGLTETLLQHLASAYSATPFSGPYQATLESLMKGSGRG